MPDTRFRKDKKRSLARERATEGEAELRKEILDCIPDAEDWLKKRHPLLDGKTPEEAIQDGEIELVRAVVGSTLYNGRT